MKKYKKHLLITFTLLFMMIAFCQITVEANTYQEAQIITGVDKWNEKGFTGSEVEVIVIDKGNLSTNYKNIKNVEDPFNNVLTNEKNVSSHLSKIVETIHLNIPDAKIYVFQDISMIYIYDWMKGNNKDIDLINFSLSRNLTDREKEVMPLFANENILMFTAIGNNAEKDINPVSKNPYWYSVGAVQNTTDGIIRDYYSGISENLSLSSFAGIKILDNYNFLGTSASTAFMTSMMGVYIDGYEKTYHKDPTRTHLENIMKTNVIKNDTMKKNEYGFGVVRLPSINFFIKEETLPTTVVEQHVLVSTSNIKNKVDDTRGSTIEILSKNNLNKVMEEQEITYLKLSYFNNKLTSSK